MARQPEVPGKPASERLTFRLNSDMLAFIDAHRGHRTRPAFIREAIRHFAQRKLK